MDAISDLTTRLASHKARFHELAAESGVPLDTLRKVADGRTKNPRTETFLNLWTTLDKWERRKRRP